VARLVESGIPVVGHIGLTPQSYHEFGGYKIQGREEQAAIALLEDARALEDAGAFCIVLEGMPSALAQRVTEAVGVPTVGIGAGPHCSGQVLVLHDLLGLDERFRPRFVKRYAELSQVVVDAVATYGAEVRQGSFTGPENGFE
jgi:3-methyl-2-oxobutanoate hydroxymethyltransferase